MATTVNIERMLDFLKNERKILIPIKRLELIEVYSELAQLRAELAAIRTEQLAAFDEMGKHHRWELDMQGRVIRELRAELAASQQEADRLREALRRVREWGLAEGDGSLAHMVTRRELYADISAALDATETAVSQP